MYCCNFEKHFCTVWDIWSCQKSHNKQPTEQWASWESGANFKEDTPLPWCNLSPAELLMGRKFITHLPLIDKQLIHYLSEFKNLNQAELFKEKQKNYDSATKMPLMRSVDHIRSRGYYKKNSVINTHSHSRSCLIETPSGLIRRNQHLVAIANT